MSKKERTPAQKAHDAEMRAVHAEARAIIAAKKEAAAKPAKSSYTPKKTYHKKTGSVENPDSVAAAYSTGYSARKPRFVHQTGDSVTIQHRELIASIQGTVDFTATQAIINPGIAATFPWLASVAQAWEQYRFKHLKFEYLTRTGSNTAGSMMLVPDFDAADEAPTTEQVAMSYQDAVEDAPWKNICCVMQSRDLHPNGTRKYVRTTQLAANLDIKTYDAGNMFLCTTDGASGNPNWGKVYAEYEVELFVPQLQPTGVSPLLAGGTLTSGGSIAVDSPFGTTGTFNGDAVGLTYTGGASSSVITFLAAGTYLVAMSESGTTMVDAAFSITPSSQAAANSLSSISTSVTVSTIYAFQSTAPNQTATIVLSGGSPDPSGGSCWIAAAPTDAFGIV